MKRSNGVQTANETEPSGPFGGTRALVCCAHFIANAIRNVCRATLFEKRGELDQAIPGIQQLESQTAAQFDVLFDLFSQRISSPSWPDRANDASESKSLGVIAVVCGCGDGEFADLTTTLPA